MYKSVIAVFIILSVLLSGCQSSKTILGFENSFDENGYYIGFKDVKEKYPQEKAIEDGLFCIVDEKIVDIERWHMFLETAETGVNVELRILVYYSSDTDEDYPMYIDLFYYDESYYAFNNVDEKIEAKPYKYLLQLDGYLGGSKEQIVMLSDSSTITFDDFITSVMSSDTIEIMKVPEYQLVIFRSLD